MAVVKEKIFCVHQKAVGFDPVGTRSMCTIKFVFFIRG